MPTKSLSAALLLIFLSSFTTTRAAEAPASPPKVVVTILPIHSLVAGVMDGIGQPHLLLGGGASPHAYALKPSDARKLAEARAVFWVGEALEAFLERPLAALSGAARKVEIMEMEGLRRLPLREGGIWGNQAEETPASGTDQHGHKGIDAHVWLDPANARTIVRGAAGVLAEIDPANGGRYTANARAMERRLDALDQNLRTTLAPVAGRPYVVFHDAYQYLERRYGLTPAGAVTVSPGRAPGAKRLMELRARISVAKADCVFVEPQFEPRIARIVVEGTGARLGTLDPLGAALSPGKDAYFALMDGLARSLAGCIATPRP